MKQPKEWEKRYQYYNLTEMVSDFGYAGAKDLLKQFISQEISKALKEREDEIVKLINEEIGDDFEISYGQDIDITEIPDELRAEMLGAKKATIGTKNLIIDIITQRLK